MHFSTIIIGNDPEESLEKYDENAQIEFIDETSFYESLYQAEESIVFIDDDGNVKYSQSILPDILEDPTNGYKHATIKNDILYPTLLSFVQDQYPNAFYEETTQMGYMGNTSSQYDWYALGGRWDKYFKSKTGEMTNQLFKKNIDFDYHMNERINYIKRIWDENGNKQKEWFMQKYITLNNCIEVEKYNMFDPYALIIDGNWYEDYNSAGDWNKFVRESIQSAYDDILISIYDLHV